jgi:hypothetical protein
MHHIRKSRATPAVALLASAFLLAACSSATSASSSSSSSSTNSSTNSSTSASSSETGAYTQDGGKYSETGKSYAAANVDESVVYVYGGGSYSLTGSSSSDCSSLAKTSGDSSSTDNSNFYGLNAIVLAASSSSIALTYCDLKSTVQGANGAFAYGSGSKVTLSHCSIETTADSSRGVDATYGGSIVISDSTISTQGAHCAALASDRYDSAAPSITATDVTGATAGEGSPGIYCTGTFNVSDSTLTATGSEAAAIEGFNSITLTGSAIAGDKKWGVIVYQSNSGDSATGQGTFSMSGGTLTNNSSGPVFMVCDTTAIINLAGVAIGNAGGSKLLLRATSASSGDDNVNSSWGSFGGTATLNATGQALDGAITRYSTASSVALNLKTGSSWKLEGDSTVDSLTIDSTSSVDKNGYTLTCSSVSGDGAGNISN